MFEWAEGPVDLYKDLYHPLVRTNHLTFQMRSVFKFKFKLTNERYSSGVEIFLTFSDNGIQVNELNWPHQKKHSRVNAWTEKVWFSWSKTPGISRLWSVSDHFLEIKLSFLNRGTIWTLSEQLDPSLTSETI